MSLLQKRMLRTVMKGRRAYLSKTQQEAPEKIKDIFFASFKFSPETIIGAYWPIGTELDVRPLLQMLILKGFSSALPCVTPKGLEFRLWDSTLSLVPGRFNALEPPPSSPFVEPDVLLVPLLAFDKDGHRLGYGLGYYDKYLPHHKVTTIGVGFKGQGMDCIPYEPHDVPMDYILTEEGVIKKSDR